MKNNVLYILVVGTIVALSGQKNFSATLYVTNETTDNTIEVSFKKSWLDINGQWTHGNSPESFIIKPGKTGSYTEDGKSFNRVQFTITGPDADQVKIFGLSGEQYVPDAYGNYVNAQTGEAINTALGATWRLWAKKVV